MVMTMDKDTGVSMATNMWGTFETVRPLLENQFKAIPFDPDSGYGAEELTEVVKQYLDDHKDTPHVTQKAFIFNTILTKAQIAIEPHDMYADKFLHNDLLSACQGIRNWLSQTWYAEVEREFLPYQTAWLHASYKMTGNAMATLDLGHLCPGWPYLLENGIPGIIKEAVLHRKSHGAAITKEQNEFYDAVELVYNGVLALMDRFVVLAEAKKKEVPEQAERLDFVISSLRQLRIGPPETFHQALQLIYLVHQLVEAEGQRVRSMGGFDRNLIRFYRADIESGRITRDQAKELIKFFWIKFYAKTQGKENGKNFYFAGQLPDGSDAVNELSVLAIEAFAELQTPDPKLSIRFSKDTPDDFMYLIAKTIRGGQASFVLTNDEVAIPSQLKYGKTLEDARNHTLIGCYEPVVEGKEMGCTTSVCINLAKDIEFVLNNGVDPLTGFPLGLHTGDPRRIKTFEEFFQCYLKQVDHQIICTTECVKNLENYWPRINPSPFLAGTFENCLQTGKDVGQGGAVYNNTGILGAFLANAADSLMAIKHLVYDEKRVTMDDLIKAVNSNFEGYEQLRQYIRGRIQKFGNNNEEVDSYALRIAEYFTSHINGIKNNRGGWFQAALYSVEFNLWLGEYTGALPDGRLAREPLAPNMNAMYGMDKGSITDLINTITKIDFVNAPNGTVSTITLHPSVVSGDDGLKAMVSLIKTFFKQGGFALQFNIFDTETLRDAQKHPEKYPNLQVRVTGWSAYFVRMDEAWQNTFIDTNKHR
jgi:formate C-acetyltransferase